MTDAWREISIADYASNGGAEVTTGPFGTQLKASDYTSHGTPVINVRNIGFGGIRPEKLEYINDHTRDRLSKHVLQTRDIVFGRKGAVERHVFIRDAQDGWFQGSDCLRLRITSDEINPQFLSYRFLTREHQQWMMNQCSHGSTMATLNQKVILGIKVRVPDRTRQDRIVEVLSSYDGLIENNRRRIALLEEAAGQLYKEWFVRLRFPGHEHTKLVDSPLGRIPEGWQVVETQDIQADKKYALNGGPFGSKLGTKDYVDHGVPVIRGANIGGSSRFTMDDFVYVSEHKADTLASNQAHPGDLIFTQRGTLGQVGMIPKKCPYERFIVSQSQMKLTVNEDLVDREYVYQFFSSPGVVQRILNHSIVAGVPHINLTTLREFKFLLPPRELQAEFARAVAGYDDFIENTTQRNKLLAEARDLLLPRLMSGEVEV